VFQQYVSANKFIILNNTVPQKKQHKSLAENAEYVPKMKLGARYVWFMRK